MSDPMERTCETCIHINSPICGQCRHYSKHRFLEEVMAGVSTPIETLDPTKLIENHWTYIDGLLRAVLPSTDVRMSAYEYIKAMHYMYTTAFQHGYKHAIEDLQSPKKDV